MLTQLCYNGRGCVAHADPFFARECRCGPNSWAYCAVRHHNVGNFYEVPDLVLRFEVLVRLCGAHVDALTLTHIDRGRCGAAGKVTTRHDDCVFFLLSASPVGAEKK
jgi:hypothetical protein